MELIKLLGSKTKIQFLNAIDLKVKDLAGELVKTALTTGAGTHAAGITTFAVDSIKGFTAGDEIYIYDGTSNSAFTTVNAVISTPSKQLKLNGDHSAILTGASIKKNEAIEHLDEAINIYSKYRPLERNFKPETFAAGYSFDLPSNWEIDFSGIISIEHPIDSVPAVYIDKRDYEIYLNDSNAYKLRFKSSLASTFRMLYTIRHSFNGQNVISAPDNDFHCICNLASAKYLLAMASRYGQSSSSLINADSVNYDNKTDQYRRLAKVYFGQAANWLGISVSDLDGTDLEQTSVASSQILDITNSDGKPTLLHGNLNPIINN